MTYGADEVQKKLRQELEHYLITQYLAKTSVLVEALKGRLDDEGILYQAPYIEAAPAYETVPDGIAHADLPAWLKTLFAALQEKHLGVYPAPFRHQIQALEAATKGRDLFVATGTGSGKTECFLWPLLAKLAERRRDGLGARRDVSGRRRVVHAGERVLLHAPLLQKHLCHPAVFPRYPDVGGAVEHPEAVSLVAADGFAGRHAVLAAYVKIFHAQISP